MNVGIPEVSGKIMLLGFVLGAPFVVFWHIFAYGPKEEVSAHRPHEFELFAELLLALGIRLTIHGAQVAVE